MVELYGRVGDEFVVNSTTDQFQSQPATVRLPSGEFVVVWASFVSPGVFGVRGQRHSADGTPIGAEFPVTTLEGNLGEPRVSALSTGGFVVTWTYDLHDGTGTNAAAGTALRIHGQIFDSAAAKVGGELTLSAGTSTNHTDSQVIGLPGGAFAVGYARNTVVDGIGNADVVVQTFDSAGAATGAVTLISASGTLTQSAPALAALAGGGFVATWQDFNSFAAGDSSGPGVKGQLFDSAGAKVGSEFLVNSMVAGSQYQPSVAALQSGGFVVTWTSLLGGPNDPNGNEIRAQIFTAAGAKVGGEFAVNTVVRDTQATPVVVGLADGGFVIGWLDLSSGDEDLKAQAFDSSGVRQGIEFTLNTVTEGQQLGLVLASLADGGFVAAWGGSDDSGPGVKAQVFGADAGAPTDIELSAAILSENAVENLPVAILSAQGALNSTFSFEILDDSSGAFRIDGDKLVVDDNAKLDFETAPQVTVTIRATDSNGQSYDETVVLDVTDVAQERRLSAGDTFLANATQAGDQGGSTLILLASGGFALLWNQYNPSGPPDPNPFKTMARFFDSAGTPVSGDVLVTSDWMFEPAIIPLAGGGFLIANTVRNEPQGMDSVKVQAYNSAGAAVGNAIFAGSAPVNTEFLGSPAAAQLDSGLYVIGWSTGPGAAVVAQRFTSGGVAVGGQIDIAPVSGGDIFALRATPGGGFVAAWWDDLETDADGDGPFEVHARFFDSSGAPTGSPIMIPAGDFAIEHVDIIALAGGGFVLGWVETIGEIEGIPVNAVIAQLIDSSGAVSGPPLPISVFGMIDDSGPDVSFSAHPDGGFLVTWPFPDLATADFETGQVTYSLNGQLFDSLGQPVGPVFQPTADEAGGSSVILADGTIATSWSGRDSDGAGVYARVFQPANEPAGTDGDDQLFGDDNPNALDGGEGDDQLFGLGGDDDLTGGAGGDLLDGGSGADSMAGGPGNDSYYVDEAGDVVTENAGEGTDEIRTGLAAFSLAGLPEVEYLTGLSESGQSLTGNAADNIVNAGSGNDFIFLQAGGNDYALGNPGNDVFLFGASLNSADQVDGGDGIDQIVLQGDYAAGSALTLGAEIAGVENLAILAGSDTRFGDPGTGFYDYEITITDSVLGEGVQMVIDANRLRAGEDLTVDGSAETDGSFFIYGGGGADRLTGGENNDVFIFGHQGQWGSGDVVTGGGGIDQLGLRGNYTITFGAGQLIGIEQIGMVSAQDTRYGPLGSSYSYDLKMVDSNVDSIQMTIDAAPLRAGEKLTFNGSAEDDGSFRVFGGRDNDTMFGSLNGDILVGNGGADSLIGGGGADVFRYVAASDSAVNAPDQILDFSSGLDKIDLSRIDADTHAAGDQAFRIVNGFSGGGAASAGELVLSSQSGFWRVEGDTDGDGNADFSITVHQMAPSPLTGNEFIL